MPKIARYQPDEREFQKYLLSEGPGRATDEAAVDIIAAAVAIAPRADPGEKGAGDGTKYIEHFSHHRILAHGRTMKPRTATQIVNDAEYAVQVEFRFNPDHQRPQGGHAGHPGPPGRPLGRAGALFGDFR